MWGIAPILITIAGKAGFDAYTQTFYRYASAAVVFLGIALVRDRPGLASALRAWRLTVPMAVAVVAFQFAWVNGLYLMTPTIAVFAEHSAVVFSLAGGALFFADERRVVLSWRFLAGAAVVAAGAVGVVLGGTPEIEGGPVLEGSAALGAVLLFSCAVAWATYSLLIKRAVVGREDSGAGRGKLRPIPAFAVMITEATLLTLVATAVVGDLGHVARVPGWVLLVLVASGAACVGAGQGLYFISIGRIGVVTSQTVTLATPFLAGLFSFLVFKERMSAFQWASGTLLVAGVAFLMRARARSRLFR